MSIASIFPGRNIRTSPKDRRWIWPFLPQLDAQIDHTYRKVYEPDDLENPTATSERLEEITEFRLTRFVPDDNWAGEPLNIPTYLLKCWRIGPAVPVLS